MITRMLHRLTLILSLVLLTPFTALAEVARSSIVQHEYPALPIALRGRAFGVSNHAILAVGGMDASEPSDRVDVLAAGAARWQTFHLNRPVGYPAFATSGDALIAIGGLDADGASAAVTSLRWIDNHVVERSLPRLPAPRVLSGAAAINNILYVFGGMPDLNSPRAYDSLFALDLNHPGAGWQDLGPCPGGGRIDPIVVGQYEVIHIFGSRAIIGPKQFQTLKDAWIYRPHPLDGTRTRGWIRAADLPVPIASAAAFSSGQAHVIFAAGDMRPFTDSLFDPQGALPQSDILAYHSVTDAWTSLGPSPLAGISPTALKLDGKTLFIGGTDRDGSPTLDVTTFVLKPLVRGLHVLDYLVILGYFAVMASIGVYFSRRQTSSTEFALGGRRTKWWVAAVSLYATGTSAISFMAIPAQAYATNLVFLMISVANGLMIIPQAYLAIPLIRRLNVTSTYEYLERRFSPSLRLLASFQCIVFQTAGRMSVVILLPSLAIAAVTGLNVFYCVLIMGTLTTFYTAIGGIDAVMWTDLAQASLMFIGPLIAIGVMLFSFHHGPAELFQTDWHYSKFNIAIFSWDWTMPVIWIFLIDGLARVAGFAGDQTMVQRVLCTPSDKEARRATIWSWIIGMTSAVIFQFMGIAFFAYFHAHPGKLDPTMNNDQILPLFIVQSLPAGIAGLIIAGLFAGSMSTLSGTMNSVATLIVEDFYRRVRPDSSDQTRLRLMKRLSYVVGATGTSIALIMAAFPVRSIFQTWNNIIALLGGGFLGMYTLGLFSRRASNTGVIIGAIASIIVTASVKAFTSLHWTLYTPVAIVSCIVTGYFASLLFPDAYRDLKGLTVFNHKQPVSPSAHPISMAVGGDRHEK